MERNNQFGVLTLQYYTSNNVLVPKFGIERKMISIVGLIETNSIYLNSMIPSEMNKELVLIIEPIVLSCGNGTVLPVKRIKLCPNGDIQYWYNNQFMSWIDNIPQWKYLELMKNKEVNEKDKKSLTELYFELNLENTNDKMEELELQTSVQSTIKPISIPYRRLKYEMPYTPTPHSSYNEKYMKGSY